MGTDRDFMLRAIELALQAEREGNLPVGAVITLDGKIIAEGRNAIWVPSFNANRHAEVEVLRAVPAELWSASEHMSLYVTLEPCLMCYGAILLHRIGRVVFWSSDPRAGVAPILDRVPPYFHERMELMEWRGPSMPAECDPLYRRLVELVKARTGQVGGPSV